ncbi:MAG: 5-methylcytosine-specific restriction endonuclease system specificity protein McrC [Coriobacteriaceae bacterium]|nr:5-methylcytosine-specific restriction endonuclease system specificity protein McrC [Coriobacteriaceae bacterium]
MIPVRNVYYMLAYAFRALDERGWGDFEAEEFDNAADLCAAILCRGVGLQLKRGLGREYANRTGELSSPRGKIELSESLRVRTLMRHQAVCTWAELSPDTGMNRILKSTMLLLLRSDASRERKRGLRRLLAYFSEVGEADLAHVDWGMRFDRTNRGYRMLMGACWLACNGLLQGQDEGKARLMEYADDQQMSRLYERFVLEYYRRERPDLTVGAPHIEWALDDETRELLPAMRSDVTLSRGRDELIVDCKYYTHDTQLHLGKRTVHSHNLYQIFTYVKNEEARLADFPHTVAGMLLYARTEDDVQPDVTYRMSGNEISVTTLNLNQPFEGVRARLNSIAQAHFPRRNMYESLTELIPELDSADEYGTWVVDREHKGTADDPIHFPYVSFGPVMWDFDRRVYTFVDGHPEYDLAHYNDILAHSGIEWSTESMEGADASKLDGQTVMALLVASLRAGRFCEGALLGFFESGAIRRWLIRLREIDGQAD